MSFNSILHPYAPPLLLEKRVVRRNSDEGGIEVIVTTSKLPGAPYYLYSVTHNGALVLQLISNPGSNDIIDAIVRHLKGASIEESWLRTKVIYPPFKMKEK